MSNGVFKTLDISVTLFLVSLPPLLAPSFSSLPPHPLLHSGLSMLNHPGTFLSLSLYPAFGASSSRWSGSSAPGRFSLPPSVLCFSFSLRMMSSSSVFTWPVLSPDLYVVNSSSSNPTYRATLKAQLSPWIPVLRFWFTIYICRHNFIHHNFSVVDLLRTHDIYCVSVRPGVGIPPLLLFL